MKLSVAIVFDKRFIPSSPTEIHRHVIAKTALGIHVGECPTCKLCTESIPSQALSAGTLARLQRIWRFSSRVGLYYVQRLLSCDDLVNWERRL